MKMPVKNKPPPKKMPELPPALANLMPKVDVGKDGNSVIRIHQSQITAEQLKSLQDNPNDRLVFRPPSNGQRGRRAQSGPYSGRRRGRPRKNPYNTARGSPEPTGSVKSFDGSPPATTRYGRHTKLPYYTKDYLSTDNTDLTDDFTSTNQSNDSYSNSNSGPINPYNYMSSRGRRGRPKGSGRSNDKGGYRRSNAYSMDMLRDQQNTEEEMEATQRLSIVPPKPALSTVEQLMSNRRKDSLKKLLSNLSQDDIMEVTLPHLARVFSVWEFLVMKVEKSKVGRTYFADVYKEYEALHHYFQRLTTEYSKAIVLKRAAAAKLAAREEAENAESLAKEALEMVEAEAKKAEADAAEATKKAEDEAANKAADTATVETSTTDVEGQKINVETAQNMPTNELEKMDVDAPEEMKTDKINKNEETTVEEKKDEEPRVGENTDEETTVKEKNDEETLVKENKDEETTVEEKKDGETAVIEIKDGETTVEENKDEETKIEIKIEDEIMETEEKKS